MLCTVVHLQALMKTPETTAFTSIPCGVCPGKKNINLLGFLSPYTPLICIPLHLPCAAMLTPPLPPYLVVFNECVEGGKISPATCVYYQEWLDF